MIISLLGKSKSGKDTSADYLVNNYGFIKKSFSDPLKKACQSLFLFSDEQLYGTQEEKETPDPRWFNCSARTALKFVGTDLLRDNLNRIMPGLENDIFIHHFKIWFEEIKKNNPSVKIVIADNRFQNETDFIKSLGGIVVKLVRNNITSNDSHQSESELDTIQNYDYLISNNQSKEKLYGILDDIFAAHTDPNYKYIDSRSD